MTPDPTETSGWQATATQAEALLTVTDLSTAYLGDREPVRAVRDVSFELRRSEVLGVVGHSGCGKTTLAMSLLRLVKPPGKITAGDVDFDGEKLFRRPRARMSGIRGVRMSLIPQAAMNVLDPLRTARASVAEIITAHRDTSRSAARERAGALLGSVGLSQDRFDAYPHELSGGMRQRVVTAMALVNEPVLVIADEPVTGLDVIVQAQILELLSELRARDALSILFISHDLGAVAKLADRIMVMEAGRVVELGPTDQVICAPVHPYTRRLVAATPRLDAPAAPPGPSNGPAPGAPDRVDAPLLRLVDVRKHFSGGHRLHRRKAVVKAVDGVSLNVAPGEIVGIIGESGSGKSTVARLILGLIRPDRGQVVFDGSDIARLPENRLREMRRSMHLVFQDPYDSLSPKMRVRELVGEPLVIHGSVGGGGLHDRVLEALEETDLRPAIEFAERYPNELSGGQRQRVALARALVLRPRLIVADEPTSMLDVPLRAGLLATMRSLRSRHGVTFVFITHDLALARIFCDRVAVMFRGQIVELGPTDRIIAAPGHPYTEALLTAARDLRPVVAASGHDQARGPLDDAATGCCYRSRCPAANDICAQAPTLRAVEEARSVACHMVEPTQQGQPAGTGADRTHQPEVD
ncbi:MAG: dipeptide ABC transporter ATP-binding protein [Pseudonocardiaceae bacterium]|nr:dipeptide ABC transporter ATP-binding protein [Pseudonocardiaceae bacterium]